MGNGWSMENIPDESNVSNNTISEEKRKKTRRAKTLRRRTIAMEDIRESTALDKRQNDTMMSNDLVVRNEPFPTIPVPDNTVGNGMPVTSRKRKTRSNRHL